MKFAICDDNVEELGNIAEYLLRFDTSADWTGFSSAQELLNAFQSKFFDIVLLDIEMDGLNGYQAAQKLNTLPDVPLIIFITQSGEYTIQGYEVAFRYIKKPVQYKDFERAVSAAVAKLTPTRLTIIEEGNPVVLRVREILYIEVFNYILEIHTIHGNHQVRMTLKALEAELKGCAFVRPHKSYLVNLEYISQVEPTTVYLISGTKVPISRNRKKQFDEALFQFLRR